MVLSYGLAFRFVSFRIQNKTFEARWGTQPNLQRRGELLQYIRYVQRRTYVHDTREQSMYYNIIVIIKEFDVITFENSNHAAK